MSYYYLEELSILLKMKIIEVCVRGYCFKFIIVSGVFFFGRFDRGMEFFIESMVF